MTDLFLNFCKESTGFLGFPISAVPWNPIEEAPVAYKRAASCDARFADPPAVAGLEGNMSDDMAVDSDMPVFVNSDLDSESE